MSAGPAPLRLLWLTLPDPDAMLSIACASRLSLLTPLGDRAAVVVRCPGAAPAKVDRVLDAIADALAASAPPGCSDRVRLGFRIDRLPNRDDVARLTSYSLGVLHLAGHVANDAGIAAWRRAAADAGRSNVVVTVGVGDGHRSGCGMPSLADNLLASPVFLSRSKPDVAPIGLDGLRSLAAHHPGVLALGGLGPLDLQACLDADACGLAVLSSAWQAPIDAWVDACRRLQALAPREAIK